MLLHTNDLSAVAPRSEWRASERSMTRGTRYAALRRVRPRSGTRRRRCTGTARLNVSSFECGLNV